MTVNYSQQDCEIENREKVTKYIEHADFVDVFCIDLSAILKIQRTQLISFSVRVTKTYKQTKSNESTGFLSFLGSVFGCRSKHEVITEDLDSDRELLPICNRIYDTIELSLQSRPLRVQMLELYASGQRQVLQVLQYTDPNVLGCLYVFCHPAEMDCSRKVYLEMDELVKLKHWRKVKNVGFRNFVTKGSIKDFGHFGRVEVTFDVVTVDDVLFLKKKFITNKNLKRFHLNFNSLESREKVYKVIGRRITQYAWMFPIPKTNQFLMVSKFNDLMLIFDRGTF